jgi:hypothetical protein
VSSTPSLSTCSVIAFCPDIGSGARVTGATNNLASRRVAEKVGATFEGVLPAGSHHEGNLQHQSYCFSLTPAL